MPHPAAPIGGPLLTRSSFLLMVLGMAGAALIVWRFLAGLGATTALNDGYPWGLWICLDVVTGTALACGGYAVALLAYVFNRGHYHPLVRPALLTSALGYSLAGFAIFIDVGRYWNLYQIAYVGRWNLDSILLEVALCVSAYVIVLWIELSPAILERWEGRPKGLRRRLAMAVLPRLDRILVFIIALGILLPTMHQSSLGSLMLLAGHKLHPLWYTPWLPLLFLLSCLTMGYAMVIIEAHLASLFFRRRRETALLAKMGGVIIVLNLAYVLLRVGDLLATGHWRSMAALDLYTLLFIAEIGSPLVATVLLLGRNWRVDAGKQFQVAMLLIGAGMLYRFDTYLVAFNPGPGWSYFPSMAEIMTSVGIISVEILAYLVLVKRFPILGGVTATDPIDPQARKVSS